MLPGTAELKSDRRADLGRVRRRDESDLSHMHVRGGPSSRSVDWIVRDVYGANVARLHSYGLALSSVP